MLGSPFAVDILHHTKYVPDNNRRQLGYKILYANSAQSLSGHHYLPLFQHLCWSMISHALYDRDKTAAEPYNAYQSRVRS
jgi:hypothetical protein